MSNTLKLEILKQRVSKDLVDVQWDSDGGNLCLDGELHVRPTEDGVDGYELKQTTYTAAKGAGCIDFGTLSLEDVMARIEELLTDMKKVRRYDPYGPDEFFGD